MTMSASSAISLSAGLRELGVRRMEWICADTYLETNQVVDPVARKVAVLVVLRNLALEAVSDAQGLMRLADAATALGDCVMPRLASLLESPAVSYGKGAIVGTQGELEHAAAILHPTLGKTMRAAIGGGAALIPSNAKIGVAGTQIDVPLGHRDNPWSFDEIDTLTVGAGDAPRPAEIVLVMALASTGRPRARVKKS